MFGGHSFSGDLSEIVRLGAGGNGVGMATAALPPPPGRRLPLELPPTETEMAAWLCEIVRGDELDSGRELHEGDVTRRTLVHDNNQPEGRCVEDISRSSSSERRKKTTSEARKSHYAETHSLTEKKRRCKINERIKTLQQLVPGCDKCNQASTLEQTIQYMKSLQQQIQAMSFGGGIKPASAAVYPVAPSSVPAELTRTVAAEAPGALVSGHARPAVVLGPPPAMVPLAPLLPLAHYPAIILPAAPMLYPNAAPLPARQAPPPAFSRKSSN